MLTLGKSYKGLYTLIMDNNERLQLESWVVNNYFSGQKTDTEHINLISRAVYIHPDNS